MGCTRGRAEDQLSASCVRIPAHKQFTVLLWELTKNIHRDLQRNWLMFFMSFLCGCSKVSLSSFIPFLSFQSSAPQPNPHLLFQEPCSFSFGILFPKRELHFCTCAALSAESATPASSQQTTSFKGWFQTFPTLRHKRLFGHSVKHYKKLKDQTHSSEPSIVTRKEIWSLVH